MKSFAIKILLLFSFPLFSYIEKGFLWEVEKNDVKFYLYGTLHFIQYEFLPLDSLVYEKLRNSQHLFLEVSSLHNKKIKKLSQNEQKSLEKLDKKIFNLLNNDANKSFYDNDFHQFILQYSQNKYQQYIKYNKIRNLLKTKILNNPQFNTIHPLYWIFFFQNIEYIALNSPKLSIESVLESKALKERKQLHSLEKSFDIYRTNKETYIKALSKDYSAQELRQAIENTSQYPLIEKYYKEGNLELSQNLYKNLSLNPYLKVNNAPFFTEREKNILHNIQKIKKTKNPVFIAIGYRHLIDENGLISLLKKENYTVKRL